MGTTADWTKVITLAIFFGGLSALFLAVQRWQNDLRPHPYLSFTEILYCAALGLSFGIFDRFDWTAFHRPLLFIEAPLLLMTVAILVFMVQKRRQRIRH
jgi:hypothetical protein